jgi:hypothetical protein
MGKSDPDPDGSIGDCRMCFMYSITIHQDSWEKGLITPTSTVTMAPATSNFDCRGFRSGAQAFTFTRNLIRYVRTGARLNHLIALPSCFSVALETLSAASDDRRWMGSRVPSASRSD